MDLVIYYRGIRFIIETKVWYGKKRFGEGKQQIIRYLTAANLAKGYIVLFSEQSVSTQLEVQDNQPFETQVESKQLRIYPIVIGK